jgi:hypothetical protein
MLQHHFTAVSWESWGLERRPLIPEGMPVLIDDDLVFEDDGGPRATVAVNRWLRELPTNGVPAPNSWDSYARGWSTWPGTGSRCSTSECG